MQQKTIRRILMKKSIWISFVVVVFVFTAVEAADAPDMHTHQPRTFVSDATANSLLKEGGFREVSKEPPNCPEDSFLTKAELGGPELGVPHGSAQPKYLEHYDEGLSAKKSRIEIWASAIPGMIAKVRFCYYDNKANNFVVIYLEKEHKSSM
jgi:hypothetical protein